MTGFDSNHVLYNVERTAYKKPLTQGSKVEKGGD